MITEKDFKKIMKAFDFERVKKAMDAVGWSYASGEPVTIEELRNMAWCLYTGYEDWNAPERCSSACGGFSLSKSHGAKYLVLSFCVEKRESDVNYA